jgi:L-rhamnose-H+ transport protein
VNPNPELGILLHAAGGFSAASCYIPFKRIRGWAWESYWLTAGVFSWIVTPLLVAWLTVPDPIAILREAPTSSLAYAFLFGVLWGIGGLTFGLSVRYLGFSLGYAMALGFCAFFGTLVPPLFEGKLPGLSTSGLLTLAGLGVCLVGIAICGRAGVRKEREVDDKTGADVAVRFRFARGAWVAAFAGVMSACMAFAIAAAKPIANIALAHGTSPLWQNGPAFIVILAGGFLTNFVWCVHLNIRHGTAKDYVSGGVKSILTNVAFAAIGGCTWYTQFMFYGMGTTQMGKYDFSSWTVHMAFIIVFSNVWGLFFREWRGTSLTTRRLVLVGIMVLVGSTIVIGSGSRGA